MPLRPPPLEPGDTIGIVAPAMEVRSVRARVEVGQRRLEERGFAVQLAEHLWRDDQGMAGTVDERLADLHALWADPSVKAIIAATGGRGAAALIDRLDYALIQRHPKIFAGLSSISSLLTAIHARTGLVTFHGPELAEGFGAERGAWAEWEIAHFLQVAARPEAAGALPGWAGPLRVLRPGRARGPLIGGNIPAITYLIGTPYWADATGAILFLEAHRRASTTLASCLMQLRLCGQLGRAAALVLGYLGGCCADWEDPEAGLQWALQTGLGEIALPVYQTDGFGHEVPNVTLPVGCLASLDATGLRLAAAAVAGTG